MNESEFQEARLNDAAQRLGALVTNLVAGRLLDRTTINGVRDIVQEFCRVSRQRDRITMPDLDVIGFARIGAIEIVRRDWEREAVQNWIVNCTVKYPDINAEEIARAVAGTWPDYRLDMQPSLPRRRRTNGGNE